MAKNVEIIIKADDQASAKFKTVQQSMQSTSKTFKESGTQAKASTELVGTFATVLGNSGVGSFAGEMAQLTERFNAFSEVADKGKVAALAFKGALVAGVAVVAYKIGEAIGNWVFQTERWNEELERATAQAEKLNNQVLAQQQRRQDELLQGVQEYGDLEERRAAAQEALVTLAAEEAGLVNQKANAQRKINDLQNEGTFEYLQNLITGQRESTEELEKQQELAQTRLDALADTKQALLEIAAGERDIADAKREQERDEARKLQSSRDYVQSLQDQLALLQAVDKEREQARQSGAQGEDVDKAAELLRQIEQEKKAQQDAADLEREKEAAQKRAASEAERLLKEQARERERLEKAFAAETNLSAKESRLLTRGDDLSVQKETAEATKKTAEESAEHTRQLDQLISVIGNRPAEEVRAEMQLVQ